MRGAVICKSAGEVSGFQEIIDESFEHVVESFLAMAPMFKQIADVGAAAFARCADQRAPAAGAC